MRLSTLEKQNRKGGEQLRSSREDRIRIHEIDLMLERLQKRKDELLRFEKQPRSGARSASALDRFVGHGSATETRDQVLAGLQWSDFGREKAGEWTFVTDKEGNLIRELEPVVDFIERLKRGDQITLGRYRYKTSENGKFLNRFPSSR